MAETAMLTALSDFLTGAGLTPAPAMVGVVDPANRAQDLPAIVLDLPEVARLEMGLGGGVDTVEGALAVEAVISLTTPTLPEVPDLDLLSEDRTRLTLPHGGLVRADGTHGDLGTADIQVQRGGQALTLTSAPTTQTQYAADPLAGRLTFGSAQPASDTVTAATGNDVGGPDGAGAMGALIPQIAEGLALLESRTVNILLVAGYGADTVAGTVLAHLERTENDGRERIAILGTRGDSLAEVAQDANAVSNKRIVLVAPGIQAGDAASDGASVDLPPAYAAALVAGRLSGLAPHISLTNKDVPASGLTTVYSRAQQKVLLGNRIMVLMQNLGFRALRGITTDTGAFTQISVRRIVDYAKAGVRKGANPYIGRLNNTRVRAALKATLDGFLAQMVQDEMLVSYELDVSATRAQEVNGIAAVTLTLRPTFSIDFVRVTMILE